MRTAPLVLAALCVCRAALAEPARVVDLDFAHTQAGCVPDRRAPGQAPVVAPTFSVYGRLRGDSAIPRRGTRYPAAAMGRTGDLNALRLGDDGQGFGPIGPVFRTGKPFTLEMWVYVYDVAKYFSGSLLVIPPGPVPGQGFSLGFQKAKWSVNGWIEWRWQGGVFWHKGFAPEQWHQVVISQEASTIALYIDGELSDRREKTLTFEEKGGRLFAGQTVGIPPSPGLDFKVDQLTIYDGALTDADVKAHYAAGVPERSIPAQREAELTSLKLDIPHDTYGYFRVGQAISVRIAGAAGADKLQVNGKAYSLPLRDPVTLSFAEPGFEEIRLAFTAGGKTLKRTAYPVAIVPFETASSKLGVSELAARQPEVTALGMRLDRVTVQWAELEPVKERYDWTRLDAVMDRTRELGGQTILCLTGVPDWVPRAEGSPNLPADMSRYRTLWRLLANRYDGVKLFEVWQATHPGDSMQGSSEQRYRDYRVMLRAAAETVRHEVPDARILAGRIDRADGRAVAAWLRNNAAGDYDIVSVGRSTADPVAAYRKTPWSAGLVQAAGKPVWSTVYGLRQAGRIAPLPSTIPDTARQAPAPTLAAETVDEWTAAAWRIQDIVLQLADGIERVILDAGPSEYDPPNGGTTGLPGPQGLALAVFNGLVGEAATVSRLPEAPAGVVAFRFEDPRGPHGLILYSTGGTVQIKVNPKTSGVRCLDLFGKALPVDSGVMPIAPTPVYLLNATLSP